MNILSLVPSFDVSAPCGAGERWLDRPTSVAEFVGGRVKANRIIRFVPRKGLSTGEELHSEARKIWLGMFQSASCQIMWDEGVLWSIDAEVQFSDARKGTLLSDGMHVSVQDHNGRRWFLRLLPAAQ